MSNLPLTILPNGILEIKNSTTSQGVYYSKGSISKYILTETPDSSDIYFVSIYEKGVISTYSYQLRVSKEFLPELHEILQDYINPTNANIPTTIIPIENKLFTMPNIITLIFIVIMFDNIIKQYKFFPMN